MGEQDHLAALVGNLPDGRSHALDAGRVRDLAVLDRHIEIDAHEHALAPHVSLIERVEHVSAHCSRVRPAYPSQPRLKKTSDAVRQCRSARVRSRLIVVSSRSAIDLNPRKVAAGCTMMLDGMDARYCLKRPLCSNRARNSERAIYSVSRGAIPPAMKTPPRAPNIRATFPAIVPSIAQKRSSAARATGQVPSNAAFVISAALRFGASMPSMAMTAL